MKTLFTITPIEKLVFLYGVMWGIVGNWKCRGY